MKRKPEFEPVFWELFFVQGEEATEYLNLLDERGPRFILEYLDGSGVLQDSGAPYVPPYDHEDVQYPWGRGDWVEEVPDGDEVLIVSWNTRLGYLGICRAVADWKERIGWEG